MLWTELTDNLCELQTAVHLNAAVIRIWIVDEANFEDRHFIISQVNIALEEPNVIKCPIRQHARCERKFGKKMIKIFRRQNLPFFRVTFIQSSRINSVAYRHLFNVRMKTFGIVGKYGSITRSSHMRSISAFCSSLKFKANS